jgi:ABC-type multidrug transport system permease subunit
MYFQSLILTFTAILIAILSLWSQLIARQDKDHNDIRNKIHRLKQLWIYMAIFIAMIAFGLFLFKMAGNNLFPAWLSYILMTFPRI